MDKFELLFQNICKDRNCPIMLNVFPKLQELAFTDALTKLYNRNYLWAKTDLFFILAQRYKAPVSCFMIDIDNLKETNDKYGHLNGDIVLSEISNQVKKLTRKSDIVVRFGGDEILVLLFKMEKKNAIKLAEKLRVSIESLDIKIDKSTIIKQTISIGVFTVERKRLDNPTILDYIIDNADKLVYKAKENGKNRIESN